jgi:oligopeptide transport system ATP-binding protein
MTIAGRDVTVASSTPGAARPRAPLLEVRQLAVHFPIVRGFLRQQVVGAVRAVDGVEFHVAPGETVGLVGESGSGKTTTGRAIIGLVRPTSGEIRFEGHNLGDGSSRRRSGAHRRLQMIFQNPFASLNPRMTIGNIVADPLRVHGIGTEAERRERVREVLSLVGLDPGLVNRYPHQFSGGQRQRVGVARALVMEPALVICDEPVSALDVSIQAQILNLLTDLQSKLGLAYLMISHDLAIVRHVSDRVAVMYLGRLMELADRETIYREPRHPYTRALLSAVHVPDPRIERQRRARPLPGEVPSPSSPPTGCRFHTRCPLREHLGRPPECEQVEPAFRDLGGGHRVACHFAERSGEVDANGSPVGAGQRRAGAAENTVPAVTRGVGCVPRAAPIGSWMQL